MSEDELRPTFPIQFDVVETSSSRMHRKTVNIGNTGGKYEWKEGSDHFEQHFAPDGSWDPATNPEVQRKHSTLYPAVLFTFLRWQESLDGTDPRKNVTEIRGNTNKTMSDLRAKLLGDAYTFNTQSNDQNPDNPRYVYTIDTTKLRSNPQTIARLERFSDRARSMNYTTSIGMPEAGEIPFISIGVKE